MLSFGTLRWGKWPNLGQGRNSDTQLSTAISAPVLVLVLDGYLLTLYTTI